MDGIIGRKFGCRWCPTHEDMTWEHPSHVVLSTCEPPPLWGNFGCHFGYWRMSLFTCGVTWWSVTFCHCQQGGPTMGNVAHNHELSKLTWVKAWNKEAVVPRLILSKDYIFHVAIFYWFHYLPIKTKKFNNKT
jgi:hypothetical protein